MNFQIEGADKLRRLGADLRRAGEVELRKSLSKRLREAVKPIVPDLRAAVLATPAKGDKSTGLRSKIARGVQVKSSLTGRSVGVRLRVDSRTLPDHAKALPKRLEGIGRWRHPVYGNRNNWVTQSAHPYFFRTVAPHKLRVQTEVAKVLDDVSREAGFH